MAKYSTASLAIKVEHLELAYLFSKMHIKLVIKSLEPNTDFLTSKIAFDYISTVYTSLSDSCLVYRFNFYQDK